MRTAPRRVLSVLAITWLNLVIAPCAMAFAAVDDCPHCPPAAEQEMAHHGAAVAEACDSMQADCCEPGAPALENKRGGKLDNKTDSAVHASTWQWPSPNTVHVVRQDPTPPDPGNYSAPFHKLFCAYLI